MPHTLRRKCKSKKKLLLAAVCLRLCVIESVRNSNTASQMIRIHTLILLFQCNLYDLTSDVMAFQNKIYLSAPQSAFI